MNVSDTPSKLIQDWKPSGWFSMSEDAKARGAERDQMLSDRFVDPLVNAGMPPWLAAGMATVPSVLDDAMTAGDTFGGGMVGGLKKGGKILDLSAKRAEKLAEGPLESAWNKTSPSVTDIQEFKFREPLSKIDALSEDLRKLQKQRFDETFERERLAKELGDRERRGEGKMVMGNFIENPEIALKKFNPDERKIIQDLEDQADAFAIHEFYNPKNPQKAKNEFYSVLTPERLEKLGIDANASYDLDAIFDHLVK